MDARELKKWLCPADARTLHPCALRRQRARDHRLRVAEAASSERRISLNMPAPRSVFAAPSPSARAQRCFTRSLSHFFAASSDRCIFSS